MSAGSPRIVQAELSRWLCRPGILILIAASALLAAVLTYFAVSAAAGTLPGSGGGLRIDTDTRLTATSTDADLASMARSSIVMLVPLSATILGTLMAGSEMTSGALLTIATAARRLRFVFTVRVVIVMMLAAFSGVLIALTSSATAAVAVTADDALAHLGVWGQFSTLAVGAVGQSVLIALVAFGLSAITRRWTIVLVGMLVYLIGVEPALTGIFGEGARWLPYTATSRLTTSGIAWPDLIPTVAAALAAVAVTIVLLRRDRAA